MRATESESGCFWQNLPIQRRHEDEETLPFKNQLSVADMPIIPFDQRRHWHGPLHCLELQWRSGFLNHAKNQNCDNGRWYHPRPKAVSFPWAQGLGWYHYIIIGLDQLQTTRTECILTEIHDTAQLGRTRILPEICIMVFSPRAI